MYQETKQVGLFMLAGGALMGLIFLSESVSVSVVPPTRICGTIENVRLATEWREPTTAYFTMRLADGTAVGWHDTAIDRIIEGNTYCRNSYNN